MVFSFENTEKDIIMTEEDEEDYINTFICRFCEKELINDKVRDHCRLTESYTGPALSKCDNNVKPSQIISIPIAFPIFSNYDSHLFFEELVHRKNDKVKFNIVPRTNEAKFSVTFGFSRFIHSYRFLSLSLGVLEKSLDNND